MTTLVRRGNGVPSLFGDLRREMDTMFDRFLGETARGAAEAFSPSLNIAEKEGTYEVSLDVPGMTRDDINVEIHNGELWISGERRSELEDEGNTWHRVERTHGQFRRVVRLGADVKADEITAEYADGVLRITCPKSETALTKRIPIC